MYRETLGKDISLPENPCRAPTSWLEDTRTLKHNTLAYECVFQEIENVWYVSSTVPCQLLPGRRINRGGSATVTLPTNERTNRQTRPITIPPGRGNNQNYVQASRGWIHGIIIGRLDKAVLRSDHK